jgi:hypothetical protein
MELTNRTSFNAALYRGCIDFERILGSLVVRLTYDCRGDRLVLAEEQSWPVSPGPWTGPYGVMEGDELFYRGGVDLFVFGSARPADGRAATRLRVKVQAGRDFSSSVEVFGNRYWEKRGDHFVSTPPEPFEAMPLTIQNAYGGKDFWDEMPIGFPGNPDGKGYVTSADTAEGKALPNIEDPDHLVQRWEDQPQPVGVCPCPPTCGPRVLGRVVFDDSTGQLVEIKPIFFNHAFPRMIAPFLSAGDAIRVTGVRPGEPVAFILPDPPVRVRVRVGEHGSDDTPPLDQVGIDIEKQQVFLTYRYAFRYAMSPLERRSCELLPATEGPQT